MNISNSQQKESSIGVRISIAIIGSFVLIHLISFAYQNSGSWISLGSPPIGVKRIIDVSSGRLWVEALDNQFYALYKGYGQFAEFHWGWEQISKEEIPDNNNSAIRGSDCKKLRYALFLHNPDEKIVECIYDASHSDSEYYALMTDGNILYWQNGKGELPDLLCLIAIRIPSTIAAIISALFLIIKRTTHVRQRTG